MIFKRLLLIFLVFGICLGTACAKPSEHEKEEAISEDTSETYKWNPYVWNESLTRAYGETAKEATFNFITALLNGEDTFEYVNEEDILSLQPIASVVCPYYQKVVDLNIETNNGIATIHYTCSPDEAKETINKFAEAVESILNVSVVEGDSDETMALMLHYNYSRTLEYEYAALTEDELDSSGTGEILDLSPYRAMVERKGFCQSFAMALVHLYLQCGLDSNLALGASIEWPHMWVYMELGEEKIFVDPTWEDTHGGTGLSFFGIDTSFYNDEEYTVFSGLLMQDDSYTGNITSDKYKPLWKMQQINSIERKDGKLVIDYIDAEGNAMVFEVDN